MIIIRKAKIVPGGINGDSLEILQDAGRLRKEVYHDQEGKFPDFIGEMMTDPHDSSGYTTILVAYVVIDGKKIPVATIRLIEDSKKFGLRLVDDYDIGSLHEDRKKKYHGPLFSVGMLAMDEKYQKIMGLLLLVMFRFLAAVAVEQGCEDVVATINYEIERFMLTLGMKRIGESFWSDEVGNEIVPVYGTIDELEKIVRRRILPPELDFLIGFNEIDEINVYNKGEDLCREGEIGQTAFFLTEGRVDILKKEGGIEYRIAELGRGNLVCEMGLLGNKKRCATIRAAVSGTVGLVLKRDKLLQCMTDPAKTLAILAKLTERLCELNKIIKKTTIDQVEKAIPLPKKLKTQIKKLKRVEYEKDRIIITQGEFGDSAYIIKKGKVGVKVDGKTVAILSRGALFGEMAWLRKDMIRVATVVALEKTVLIKLEKDLMADIEFLNFFCLTMFLRIRKMNELLTATDEKKHLGKKLKETLLEIYSAKEMEKIWKDITDFDEEKREAVWVAERVGCPVEELRPYLNYLISQGIIKEKDGVLIVADKKKLEEVVFKIDLTLA